MSSLLVCLCIVANLRAGRSGVGIRQVQDIFLFTKPSRPALGPTQSPIKAVTGVLSPVVKRPGSEVHNSPPYSAEVQMSGAIHILPLYAFTAWRGITLHFINFQIIYSDSLQSLIRGLRGQYMGIIAMGSMTDADNNNVIRSQS
jgi:hypothetical protein